MTDIATGIAPDGRPWVHPLDRASWRAWLIAEPTVPMDRRPRGQAG